MPTKPIILLALSLVGSCSIVSDLIAEENKNVTPYCTVSGTKSGIVKRSFYRIEDANEWKTLWQQHQNGTKSPVDLQIDFTDATLVGLFDGKDGNNTGLEIKSIDDRKDSILIRYRVKYYSTGAETPSVETSAYAILALPKTSKKIIIEEDVRTTINSAALWETRTTLERLDKK